MTGDIKGLKLGLPKEYMIGGLDPEVKQAVDAAVQQFAKLGRGGGGDLPAAHRLRGRDLLHHRHGRGVSANLARFDGIRYGARVDGADPIELYGKTRGAGFGPEVKRRIILGTYVLSSGYYDAYYLRAQKVRTLIRQDFLKAFEKVDAIVTPTSPTAAFKIGEKSDDPLQMYLTDIFTISCNLAGICGISVPCGFTGPQPRLPIGLQLLGKPFGEETILRSPTPTSRAPSGTRKSRRSTGSQSAASDWRWHYQGRRIRKNSLPAAGKVRLIRLGPAAGVLVTHSHCADGPRAPLPSRRVSAMVLGQERVTWLPARAMPSRMGLLMTMLPLTVAEAVDTVAVTLQL